MHPSIPIDIASRRELFVDNYLIDNLSGTARLKMHPPKREEVVLHPGNPGSAYYVLVQSDSHCLLYHNGYHGVKKEDGEIFYESIAHVLISDDGIHFTRPELGIHDLGDGGKNNVFWMGNPAHNFIPFRDANPAETNADRKFKAIGGASGKLYAFYSADGLHWRQAREEPLKIVGQFDSANLPLWDPGIGKYRLFSRFYRNRPAQHREGEGRRSIQSCVSDDFLNWSDTIPHQYAADAPDEQFYTNATILVPDAEHILLSFPMRYVAERETPLEDTTGMASPGDGTPGMYGMTDAVMMSSRDGVHWQRPFLDAWMRAGLDERNWTHRNSMPAIGILPLRDDEWSMYISEHYDWPDNRLRRLSLRPWGFASVNAGWHGGEVVTKPVTFTGSELRLNFSTSAVGSVAVEVQQPDGSPVPGFALDDMEPIYGDRLDAPVKWKTTSDLSALSGAPVRLRFVLKDADIFAFRFQPRRVDGSSAGDPFPSAIPEAFGVNSHYWDFAQGGNQGPLETWSLEKWEAPWGQLDPMADMGRFGFPLHRSTVAWNVNEPSPGTYNWKLQDALMKENARCGLRPLLFLAYGHPRYDASSGPSETCGVHSVLTPEGIAGYAAWAGEVARRYRGRQVIYEIWNEPNIHIFWPKPDPDAYMALVEAAAAAIRAVDPTALIAGGALSNVWGGKWDELDLPYLTRCLEKGLLEHVDILSFHPYNLFPPERIRDRQIIPIRGLIAQYAPAGKQIELLITEVGYGLKAGSEEGEIGFGLSNAAFEKAYFNELGNYLPRTLLSNLSLGVPTVWYELNSLIEKPRCPAPTLPESQPVTIDKACDKARDKDCLQPSTLSPSQHSQNPSQPSLDNPDHPGLFFHPNRATWGYTPGVAAVRVLSNTLRGYSFHQRLEVGDPQDDFVFELRNGERRALALWTAAEDEREIVLPLPAGAGKLVTYEGVGSESGVKTPVQWPAKQLKLTLNNWPKYLLITEE